MEKITTLRTAISPEEKGLIQASVADIEYYRELEDGSVAIETKKAIVFSISR